MAARHLVDRRTALLGSAAGLLGLAGVSGCGVSGSPVGATSGAVRTAEAARRRAGQRVVSATLTARPATLDLGGRVVQTWAYGDTLPGPVLRARAGDLLRVRVDNALPVETSVHWHGIALRNDMDGVPGMTQDPIAGGARFLHEFTVPDPGTYFYHPHTGVQLDRGLYGALVVEDPAEAGGYDEEWVLVLDDWVDGTGRTPDGVLDGLRAGSAERGHPGMGHGSMGMGGGMMTATLGGAGDVDYPYYLANGRLPSAPDVLTARPGQRLRIRLVNAGADTAFRVALAGHSLTVTHSDGFAVRPQDTDALLVGMGERYDIAVTLGDGVFPFVAVAEGKSGSARSLVRTSGGSVPPESLRPGELDGRLLSGTDLVADEGVRLTRRSVDRSHDLVLAGSMAPYRWTINGDTFEDAAPLAVRAGERVRLRLRNASMMFHPVHVHGHTFALATGGARKDTVVVRPMDAVDVELDATNPGQWAAHCHNVYHAESGMMTTLSYRT
ncbi:multicopper oxidase family protein [Oryzobacter sp. R7]|uniref:multicopper oxidase family protein n=1 Tax=Oryzobacter faecalis TaxID=3388656 RepID=UPI00398CCE47